ncbi:hypothetical protein B0H13DRAFT_2335378 [Mycena leptocephala]|nr:hypothetical protein B0H13DRAFT_2335378 [Mycena leptocephala]
MQIDRLRRLPGYRDPRADCYSLYELFTIPASFFFSLGNSVWTFVASCTASFISPIVLRLGFSSGDAQAISADDDYARPKTIHAGLCLYSPFPETDEADVVSDDDPGDITLNYQCQVLYLWFIWLMRLPFVSAKLMPEKFPPPVTMHLLNKTTPWQMSPETVDGKHVIPCADALCA